MGDAAPIEPTCGSCRFWKFFGTRNGDGARMGLCRRYPPSLGAKTEAGDWCGEHKPAGTEP